MVVGVARGEVAYLIRVSKPGNLCLVSVGVYHWYLTCAQGIRKHPHSAQTPEIKN